jgi:hypothetical protein
MYACDGSMIEVWGGRVRIGNSAEGGLGSKMRGRV